MARKYTGAGKTKAYRSKMRGNFTNVYFDKSTGFPGHRSNSKFTRVKKINKVRIVQASIIIKNWGLSAAISFTVFFMVQVIWADYFVSQLPDIRTGAESMSAIQLLLLLGLFSGMIVSVIIFLILGREKNQRSKGKSQMRHMLESALISMLLTFATLIIISFISVFVYDPLIFEELNLIEYFGVIFEVMADFVIFIYPNPTGFWLISIAVYYSFLLVIFIFKVPRSREMDARKIMENAERIRSEIRKSGNVYSYGSKDSRVVDRFLR